MKAAPTEVHRAVDTVLRTDRGRLLASLSTSLRDFSLAEDCLQEAIEIALQKWGRAGVPDKPQAWLLSVARRRAIDVLRRDKNFKQKAGQLALLQEEIQVEQGITHDITDNRLRLIFTCCHPALNSSAHVALTLHTLGGLSTAEIARAFLVPTPTMAQRIVRAKTKIKQAGIPFEIPDEPDRANRMQTVLKVIYRIYNEGYSVTQGRVQLRIDLCEEALFLARMMVELSPDEAEPMGLLALILFSHSRRRARLAKGPEFAPLHLQDRTLWDGDMIAQGHTLLEKVLPMGQLGAYQLQAAIHGLHCVALSADETDWKQIAELYAILMRMEPSTIIMLNQAVAMSFAGRADVALTILQDIEGDLQGYQPFYAAKADTLARLGHIRRANAAYDRAIELSKVDAERKFLKAQNLKAQKKRPSNARPLSPTGR
jgi:RNA polymerase sigma-70 factor, ECF subfamily